MKRIRIRVVLGWGLTLGVLLGNVGDIVYQNMSKPYVYASEYEEEVVEPKEVLIGTKIDWTPERIEKEIRATFPEDTVLAVAIGKSESGKTLKPTAYNPEWHYDKYGNPVCQGSYGVMQIACVHHVEDPEALYDVQFNLEKAKQIREARGTWNDWGGYTSGKYRKYIE